MKASKIKFSNVVFLIIIVLLIIPQTRTPIQVFIQKGFAMISPSSIDKAEQKVLTNYDWILIDQNGNSFNFEEAKGKVVFLSLWATWCPPCIAEMPSVMSLYNDYNEDVVFLLVTNEESEKVLKFQSKNNYNFDFFRGLEQPPKVLRTNSIPQTYIIDKSGKIVIAKNGAANWNSEAVRSQINILLKE